MTLSALIRKGGLQQVATAIPATFATEEENMAVMVARIATVAVAKPPTHNKEEPPKPPSTGGEVATAISATSATSGTDRNKPPAPLPVDAMTPEQFEDAGQGLTWQTASGRTVFIAPSWAVEKYRRSGEAWFTPWEIVELKAMQVDRDTIERIIDGKEIMGLEVVGTC